MARKPTLTQQTNADSHAAFKAAVATLGQKVDPSTERRHAVLVDGVALGERQSEMRKAGTSFYEQTFSEANAVAHLAVNLGLDREGVVDVLRRPTPRPDTELTVGGSTVAFVEQTMVMDQAAHRLTLEVETLNAALVHCEDTAVRTAFDTGMLTVRLNEIPIEYYGTGLPVDDLAAEIYGFVLSLSEDTSAVKVDKARFPLLGEMRAFGSYRLPGKTYNPVSSLVDHGRANVLHDALVQQIRKKRVKAAGYPSACRPLWLLLDFELHFGWRDD
ncbi:MAG: hypothetical protein ACREQ5_39470, partial [Candidatus Dormibacteria bacterium]